jgi:DNA-binding response OmpR family regulator
VAYPNASEFLKDRVKGDLYLVDLNLPGIDGTELCKLIKADGSRSTVIMMSADPDIRQLSIGACADDYLSKPFNLKDVRDKARLFLDNVDGPA